MHEDLTCGCHACAPDPTISSSTVGLPQHARQATRKPRRPRKPGY